MASRSHTLYTTLEWDQARKVAAGLMKLSDALVSYPLDGEESFSSVVPSPFYVMDEKPMVPDSATETLLAVRFPESVDLDLFEEGLACDAPMSWFHLPERVLDLGVPEFVPYGILVEMAVEELKWPQGPCHDSLEEQIRLTPKAERAGRFGHYHLEAFEAEYGHEDIAD